MSVVKSKNSGPEIIIRKLLHRLGYRFRLHRIDLPGRPDLTFPSRRKVVEIRGCFWHLHEGCRNATLPRTRYDCWKNKLDGNAARDSRNVAALQEMGWKVLVVWECELNDIASVEAKIRDFLGTPGQGPRAATSKFN